MDPVEALDEIALLLEMTGAPGYKARAFRTAARAAKAAGRDELAALDRAGRLRSLRGLGDTSARVVHEALAGERPAYLVRLEGEVAPATRGGLELLAALRGDLHCHTDWSDGGASLEEMARGAAALGHEYLAITDHSPRLTVAHGLTAERLREQLDAIDALNTEVAPLRVLRGIEVDINEDGTLDCDDELLERVDVVVASVHSELRMPAREMTARMVAAVAHPHVDVLGHCTGRLIMGRGRPESTFDAEVVFAACARFGVAVEINCRPERLDPPRRLLRQAVELGCSFAISTDAHAVGQLRWQSYGCARAVECGVTPDRVLNARPADDLLAPRAA